MSAFNQIMAAGDTGLAGRAAAKDPALLQQPRPRGPMDGAVHPAAAEQGFIGGIDDGVNIKACDVAFDDGHFLPDAGVCHNQASLIHKFNNFRTSLHLC